MNWLPPFLLGLISSIHCLGMCGPIALALPLKRTSFMTILSGILLNNTARISGYALLGAVSGSIGTLIRFAGFQSYLSVISGVFMIVFTVLLLKPNLLPSTFLSVYLKKLFAVSQHQAVWPRLVLIGFLNALLPCGLVYVALAGSIAAGSLLSAAGYMALFGLGTLPMMILIAFAAKTFINPVFRAPLRKMTPVLVLGLGCLLILRGMGLGIPYISPKMEAGQVNECCIR